MRLPALDPAATSVTALGMRKIIISAVFLALSTAAVPAQTASPRSEVRRNAQEMLPAALIGTWKLDLAASAYESAAPKAQYRIFDYTHDGMVLCDYITLSASGNQTAGNWAATLDGAEHIEYTRPYGSTPFAVVTLKKMDEFNLALTAARYGTVFETGTFTLSPDGNTLTFDYLQGPRKNHAVYRRWNMAD